MVRAKAASSQGHGLGQLQNQTRKTMESKSTEEQHLPGLLVFLDLDGKCMGAYFMTWLGCMTRITIKNNFK